MSDRRSFLQQRINDAWTLGGYRPIVEPLVGNWYYVSIRGDDKKTYPGWRFHIPHDADIPALVAEQISHMKMDIAAKEVTEFFKRVAGPRIELADDGNTIDVVDDNWSFSITELLSVIQGKKED